MLRFAHWDGLSYYLKEDGPSKHTVLVQDDTGKKALINLETGSLEVSGQTSISLSFVNLAKAQKFIRNFRQDILDYWNEMKASAKGNL